MISPRTIVVDNNARDSYKIDVDCRDAFNEVCPKEPAYVYDCMLNLVENVDSGPLKSTTFSVDDKLDMSRDFDPANPLA